MAAVARSYVQAGSDVIMTNTLMAHRFGLAPYGAAGRAAELAEAAAGIARKAAAGTDVKVFGSFGPSGKIVMMGEVAEEDLAAAFAEKAAAVEEIGVTLDLSESRVSQMHSSIVARLKAQMNCRKKEFVIS